RAFHLSPELGRRQLRSLVKRLGEVVGVRAATVDELEPAGGLARGGRVHGNGWGSGFRSSTVSGRDTRPDSYAASYNREPPRKRASSIASSWQSSGAITLATWK